jgi:hypothetical protein
VNRYLQMQSDTFRIVNAELFVDGALAGAETEVTTTQTFDLPGTADFVEGSITGAGGGGASAKIRHEYGDGNLYEANHVAGSAGEVSKIEILDGTTVVHTVTANGGAGGSAASSAPGQYGLSGQTSTHTPYGDGGTGGSSHPSNAGGKGGLGGSRGDTVVLAPFDYTGLADPKIRFTIGEGGDGAPQVTGGPTGETFYASAGSDGQDGVGYYRTKEATEISVGAVAPNITASGTTSVTSGTAGSLPDLGRGAWTLTNVPLGLVLSQGAVTIVTNTVAGGALTFFADGLVSFDTSHSETRNVDYTFWVMS